MLRATYNIALTLATPPAALALALHPTRRPLLARFRPETPTTLRGGILVHACSVGEAAAAAPFVKALKTRFPAYPVAMTASTISGHALASKLLGDSKILWFPFDLPLSTRGFLHRLQPRALVLVETEVWPNTIHAAHTAQIPVIIVNGRISDKSYPRFQRFSGLFRPAFAQLAAVGAQDGENARRFERLGVNPARIHVTGPTKFDAVSTELDEATPARLRAENGFAPTDLVILFGSTRPGDEALAARCWRVLRDKFPQARLLIAPRHLERLPEALAPFDEPIYQRTAVKAGVKPAGERIFVLDTVGELGAFYGIATVACIGGSFYPGVNGHNPLEPAALAIPIVFGPYMGNFAEAARILVEAGGASQVAGPEELLPELERLLAKEAHRTAMGQRARQAVLDNRGAIDRNLDLIEEILRQTERS